MWRLGYDSLDAFYAAHEARHPDIRFYSAVYRELDLPEPEPADFKGRTWPPAGTGEAIVRRLAELRHAGVERPTSQS